MEPWRTAIVEASDGQIRIRGYDVTSLMTERTFTDTIFLLHRSRLPTAPGTGAARRDPVERGRPRLRRAVLRRGADRAVGQSAVGVGGDRRRHPCRRRRTRRRRLGLHGDDCRRHSSARSASRSRSTNAPARGRETSRASGRRVAGLRSSRAYARSAHAGAVRPGAAQRARRRRHPLHGGARRRRWPHR